VSGGGCNSTWRWCCWLTTNPLLLSLSCFLAQGQVKDAAKLLRTTFFPGLGWFLSRKLWEEELQNKWPKTHWDHWMRAKEQYKTRDCLYPEKPRTYHNGIKGTFMDQSTHDKYFAHVGYNVDADFRWR